MKNNPLEPVIGTLTTFYKVSEPVRAGGSISIGQQIDVSLELSHERGQRITKITLELNDDENN